MKKYSKIYNTSEVAVNNDLSEDTVWIPSAQEIFGGSSYETSGTAYSGLFAASGDRKKTGIRTDASTWWLRSAYTVTSFRNVSNTGTAYYNTAENKYTVALGFCT